MLSISRQFQGLPSKSTIFKAAKFSSTTSSRAIHANKEPSKLPITCHSWVSDNALFKRHPRLHFLEKHCKSHQQLKQVLSYVFVSGLRRNPFVMSRVLYLCLHELEGDVNMKLSFGVQVLDQIDKPNTFSWNTIIRFFANCDDPEKSLITFQYYTSMLRHGVFPDKYTFPFLLQACGSVFHCRLVKQLHCHVTKLGFDYDLFAQNALINAYMNCGFLSDARELFDEMSEKDVVSWTTLISGHVAQGCYTEALNTFCEMSTMDDSNTRPNVATIVSALSACGNLGSLDHTKCFHALLQKGGWIEMDISICNSLIDAYAKCGSLNSCAKVFKDIDDDQKDLYTWTAMILALAVHGKGTEAHKLFCDMVRIHGVVPDAITFIAVLSACAHSGMVQEGLCIFELMKSRYGIEPNLQHYGCIIDLLGKAGMLEKAYQIVQTMPTKPNLAILGSLLSACRIHKKMDLGETVLRKIGSLSGSSGGASVLLSNIYANENRWNEVIHIRKQMRAEANEKPPGLSWIQVKGTVHEFVAGDTSHSETTQFCMVLGLETIGKTL